MSGTSQSEGAGSLDEYRILRYWEILLVTEFRDIINCMLLPVLTFQPCNTGVIGSNKSLSNNDIH